MDMLSRAEPVESDTEDMCRLRLPEGAFRMDKYGCAFYPSAEVRPDGSLRYMGDPVRLTFRSVARVDGDAGELWLNNFYIPDPVANET